MKGVFKWSPIVRAYGKRLFILAISCLPLLVYSCAQASDKDSLFVRRDGYWEDRREEVYVSGLGQEEYRLDIPVSGKEYTKEEREAVLEALLSWLPAGMAGGNPSLMEIRKKLTFPRRREGYGTLLFYEPEDFSLIDSEGHVYNENLRE